MVVEVVEAGGQQQLGEVQTPKEEWIRQVQRSSLLGVRRSKINIDIFGIIEETK